MSQVLIIQKEKKTAAILKHEVCLNEINVLFHNPTWEMSILGVKKH